MEPCRGHTFRIVVLKTSLVGSEERGLLWVTDSLSSMGSPLGCALSFASEAKFETEAKIWFRLEAKKSLISHDSLRFETPKI